MARPKGGTSAEETRNRIVEAAIGIFAELGFHQATLAQIAAKAGMRAPSLLYHFDSKDVLFDEVVRCTYRSLSDRLFDALPESASGDDIIAVLLSVLRDFGQEKDDLLRVVNAELLGAHQPVSSAMLDSLLPLLDMVEDMIRQSATEAIHPDAPLRPALLNIIAAHAVRSNLREIADDLWGTDDRELEVATLLASAAVNWRPAETG